MKNFIQIHHEGGPVLLSVSHIAEVVPYDDGVTIYLDFCDASGGQAAWMPDESYDEIVSMIAEAVN